MEVCFDFELLRLHHVGVISDFTHDQTGIEPESPVVLIFIVFPDVLQRLLQRFRFLLQMVESANNKVRGEAKGRLVLVEGVVVSM